MIASTVGMHEPQHPAAPSSRLIALTGVVTFIDGVDNLGVGNA